MTCLTILEKLGDLLEGRLSGDDRASVEVHLLACDDCRELKSLMVRADDAPPPGLLEAILLRTSGSTCAGARARLCDHVDRLLDPADDELVTTHLSGCRECAALAAVLGRLRIDLPALAEIEPGEAFSATVFARTSRRANPLALWTDRLAATWQKLAHRPRIAWEGAYVVWVILAILFGTPSAPFAEVPGRALALARTVQESVHPSDVGERVGQIGIVASARFKETESQVRGSTRDLATGAERRLSTFWSGLKQKVGTAWDWFASGGAGNENDKGGR